MEAQSAGAVLMVRPACFGFNPQTASSNAFQRSGEVAGDAQALALLEFDAVAQVLKAQGIRVFIAQDTADPIKPDAIFPNNWVSFHADGTVILYPMLALNRRLERREDILAQLAKDGGFRVRRTLDLGYREAQDKFLEGTGSMVLDRAARIAFACLSPRTDLDVLGEFAQQLDYELVTFEASDAGRAIYHTNVLMMIGTGYTVICTECIEDGRRRDDVLSVLKASGHEVVEIDRAQMHKFAGNMLELSGERGRVLVLSTTALNSLKAEQIETLKSHAMLVPVSIPTIEHLGGGGIRCMLAEVHLPRR